MYLIIIWFLAIIFELANANFLGNLKKCKRSDPKIDDCLKTAIELALPILEKGVAEFDIPPMQPLYETNVLLHSVKILNFEEKYSNTLFYNHAKSKIYSVESKVADDSFWIKVKGYNPKIWFEAGYEYKDANLLGLNVTSTGNVTVTHYGYDFEIIMSGRVEEKKGFKQLTITDSSLTMAAEGLEAVFKNESPELSKQMTEIVTKNGSQLFDVIKKQFSVIYANAYENLANKIFSKIDFDELFPKV